MEMTRNEFVKTIAGATALVATTGSAASLNAACSQQSAVDTSIVGLSLGVSIYSYLNQFTTEDSLAFFEKSMADIADMGAQYVEIIGESVYGYPNPPTSWINKFNGWLEKYNLKPSAFDIYVNAMFYKNRMATPEELIELLIFDLKIAKQLGFKVFRQLMPPYPADDPSWSNEPSYIRITKDGLKFFELAIPYLEKYDIKFALELHSPVQLRSRYTDSLLGFIEKTKTKHLGFCPDFGMFQLPKSGTVENLVKQGAKKEIIEYIISAYKQNIGSEKAMEEVKKMGGGQIELNYASNKGLLRGRYNDPNDLNIVAPYIYHTHAKFYNMLDDLSSDDSINYPLILENYVKNGVKGVLSTEYEGTRPDITIPTHIRMQHSMMRNILASL